MIEPGLAEPGLDDVEASGQAPGGTAAPPPAEGADHPAALGSTSSGRRHRLVSAATGAAGLLAAGAALTALLDAISTRFVPGNSDGATVALEGASVSAGNLALHGWAISLDSFWTLDVVFYALAVRIAGLGPYLLNLVPALIAAVTVLVSAALARAGRGGVAGAVAVAVVIGLVALPSPDLAYFLLQGPWHVATALCALAAFGLCARPGFGCRWTLGVVLLAAGVLGDVMIVTFGLLPLVACGIVAMLRCRNLRAGVATLAAAPAGAVLALAARVVAQAVGTFTLVNRNVPIRWHQLAENVGNLANRLPGLLGVGTIPQSVPGGAVGFEVVRAIGLVGVLVAAVVALSALARGAVLGRAPGGPAASWRLEDLLVAGILADLATFVWGAGSNNTDYAKYLTPAVLLGAVLAGRCAGRLADALTARSAAPAGRRSVAGMLLAAGTAAVVATFAGEVGVELSGPVAAQPARQLSSFLAAHHLARGVGDYWSSTIVTVESSGVVAVRPVTPAPNGTLRRYERQSPQSWYAGQHFDFFVYNLAKPWRNVNAKTAEATWGAPARTYAVGTYRVLVWSRPFTVSTTLPSYGSPLQIFWSPGAPRSSTTTTVAATHPAPQR
ncbi:MAG TPA: hypothetical protein VMD59_18585 [Acidimicrobiales bacterium]|nr:hypothetical protein [Acidimicrobiales bacterium]